LSVPRCPNCSCSKVWRDGLRETRNGYVQRYICRDCGYRFSISEGSDPIQKVQRQILNCDPGYPSKCRVRVADGAMVNLAEVESRTEKQAAGATKLSEIEVKGKIVEFAWWMKKEGYAEPSVKGRVAILKALVKRGANLCDPESVKQTISEAKTWSNGHKRNAVYAYSLFAAMEGITWKPPKYERPEKFPFIPTGQEIDQLISTCGKKIGVFLQGLKETGADPGELWRLRWIDVDLSARTVTINYPVKGHNPRIIKVSQEFINRLNTLPRGNERVFSGCMDAMYVNFWLQRKTATRKFNNQRLMKITFTTFRHWKGTMEYHRTKDILHVQRLLGHKDIRNTMIYINLEQAIFNESDDQCHVKVARNLEEACKLAAAGFDKFTEIEGVQIFRKRK